MDINLFDGTQDQVISCIDVEGDELRVLNLLLTGGIHTISKIARRLNDMGGHDIFEKQQVKTTTRKVFQLVRNLRELNYPICGCSNGIFMALGFVDVTNFAKHLEKKAKSDIKSMMYLRKLMLSSINVSQACLFDNLNLDE